MNNKVTKNNSELSKTDVRRSCNIVPYGDEERLCRTCGYVLWEDKGKTNEDILNDMINSGYPSPNCKNNCT